MFESIEWQYPAPRPVVPFEDWLEEIRTGQSMVNWDLETPPGHFEVRNTYAEYQVALWEHYKALLVDVVSEERLGQVIGLRKSMIVNSILPRDLRNRAWRALPNIFLSGFEPFARYTECGQVLGNQLDSECFMWWDDCAYYPGSPETTAEDDAYFLAVCQVCLDSPNLALQVSALHGLGHSIGIRNGLKESVYVIGRYLDNHPNLPREVQNYAKKARRGRVQ